ncbi:hypothetical protein SCLCIDRAFT_686442 [Scleroderma citrinum Foug A]|uniref:Uncharacterized protein n=1 Tax=Scleroderma citrinum Foug A TaxID=1036808 RepID=A0A0C3D4M3_9AGAM|nr:hypothetical protein SCLCIDRAFT_686442 [Scleroderma citrinum Foug A]
MQSCPLIYSCSSSCLALGLQAMLRQTLFPKSAAYFCHFPSPYPLLFRGLVFGNHRSGAAKSWISSLFSRYALFFLVRNGMGMTGANVMSTLCSVYCLLLFDF